MAEKLEWEIRPDRMEINLALLIEEGRKGREETNELRQAIGNLVEVVAPLISHPDLPTSEAAAGDDEESAVKPA